MNILFLSNFYNHHQSCISQALYKQTNGQYRFVATEKMPEERKKLGYVDIVDEFVLQYGEDSIRDQQIQQLIDGADAVIIGSAPEYLIEKRKKMGKLIFRYSERPLKNGFQIWKYPLRWMKWHIKNPSGTPIYMLCASGFTAEDYRKFGMFCNKTYKWGYFPEVKKYDLDGLMARKKTNSLLWCGRFIDWKHPDDAIRLAKKLKECGYEFRLNMVGTGVMEDELKQMVSEYCLEDSVYFLGTMPPDLVRIHMEEAGIYLFTSDRCEGWGAVLNEAMNSGCAVVAGHVIGAVPYLLSNNENGFIYKSGDLDMLYERVKYLLDNSNLQYKFGKAAYETICKTWNAQIAAERFIELVECILNDKKIDIYSDGPCSKAEVIKDSWFDG